MFRALKNHWRKLVVAGAVMMLMAAEAIFLTANHWWMARNGARITYKGQSSARSSVYLSHDDNILVRLQEEGGPSLYVVDPLRSLVAMAKPSRFVFIPGYAYCRDDRTDYTLMQSVKIEVDPQLVLEPRAVEFNSFEKGRVRVTW